MKSTRKGFTLVELLIVIGVIGILGAMGMVSGTEATNIATATKIVEDFHILSAAMNMYYADNKAECDTTTDAALPAKILAGIAPYMKSTDSVLAESGTNTGKYLITVATGQWWLTYTLPEDQSKVGLILKNKASQEGFNTDTTSGEDYAGGTTVCLQVR